MNIAQKRSLALEKHFEYWHNNPPAPFNPLADPKAKKRYELTTKSLQERNFYETHTREECKIEWGKTYDKLKSEGY